MAVPGKCPWVFEVFLWLPKCCCLIGINIGCSCHVILPSGRSDVGVPSCLSRVHYAKFSVRTVWKHTQIWKIDIVSVPDFPLLDYSPSRQSLISLRQGLSTLCRQTEGGSRGRPWSTQDEPWAPFTLGVSHFCPGEVWVEAGQWSRESELAPETRLESDRFMEVEC